MSKWTATWNLSFLSTLSLRRATILPPVDTSSVKISIHALLAESDAASALVFNVLSISIHALLAESDGSYSSIQHTEEVFLSTLSLRRATAEISSLKIQIQHFYPRSPCGERHHGHCAFGHAVDISIHALLAESDARNTSIAGRITSFLSTLSLRRATSSFRFLWC